MMRIDRGERARGERDKTDLHAFAKSRNGSLKLHFKIILHMHAQFSAAVFAEPGPEPEPAPVLLEPKPASKIFRRQKVVEQSVESIKAVGTATFDGVKAVGIGVKAIGAGTMSGGKIGAKLTSPLSRRPYIAEAGAATVDGAKAVGKGAKAVGTCLRFKGDADHKSDVLYGPFPLEPVHLDTSPKTEPLVQKAKGVAQLPPQEGGAISDDEPPPLE